MLSYIARRLLFDVVPTTVIVAVITFAIIFSMFASCSSTQKARLDSSNTTPRRGGMIRYASTGTPLSLDLMITTSGLTAEIATHVYDGLFALDSQFMPKPSLAEGFQIENQGRRCVITLRQEVLFHNGQEMTSADVLASLKRWSAMTQSGRLLFGEVDSISATDKYRLVIDLKAPMPLLPNLLSVPEGQAAIYPKSVIDAAGEGDAKEVIGTGPYRFVSWRPGQYVELARFEKYHPRSEPADGMAGRREAYADVIRFIPVPEIQQRVQGVLTGLYDFAVSITPDFAPALQRQSSIEPVVVKPFAFMAAILNKKQGIFKNLKMRQAVQAAADSESMFRAAFGESAFYGLDPALFYGTRWASGAGKSLYNQKDTVRAKRLLHEAGYRGESIRILVSSEYEYYRKTAIVLQSQLGQVGMRAVTELVDTAHLLAAITDPSAYDIAIFGWGVPRDPTDFMYWDASRPGWWVNQEKDSLVKKLASEPDFDKRLAIVSRLQELWYADATMVSIGHYAGFWIKNKKLQGPGLSVMPKYFFNAWISE